MLKWLEAFPISEWVATSDWGYPILLSIHSMGMATVVGILLILDFRVLGYGRRIPISAFDRLMPVAWGGFFVNLVSGILLFMSTASRLVSNWPFLSKMASIIVAGVVSWALWRALQKDGWPGEDLVATSAATKRLAVVSIVVWILAIIFGRLIAYVMDAALLHGGL